MTPADRLAGLYPWPATRPDLPEDLQGWFGPPHRRMLAARLGPATRLVVELGSWKGKSTRFLAEAAPHATIVAIDHWRGSEEHHADLARYAPDLERLHDQFLANLWHARGRVVPVREEAVDGMGVVAALDLEPDLVYIDAAHDEVSVYLHLTAASRLFPRAAIVGDDYYPGVWPGVVAAVDRFAGERGLAVETDEIVWALSSRG